MPSALILCQQFAMITAAFFAGAAVYVSFAEQPARLLLDNRALLTQWKPSYRRGFVMQASLVVASTLFGIAAFWITRDWRWLLGATLMFLNWPYTLLCILPVNKRLEATAPDRADASTRSQVERWGALHGVRSALGVAATIVYLWAMN
jgi:hypothetical protein